MGAVSIMNGISLSSDIFHVLKNNLHYKTIHNMKKFLFLLSYTILFSAQQSFAQKQDPAATEVWQPEPKIVTKPSILTKLNIVFQIQI